MRTMFSGYYRPTDEEFKDAWENSIFIVDANVLLNLYRYPRNAQSDLLNTLEKIKDRLWIPYHVALEYQRNRITVVAEQIKRFEDVRSLLSEVTGNLSGRLDQLQLKKRHSSINPDKFLQDINRIVTKFLSNLDDLEKDQPDVYSEDKLREKIDSLFSGKIGPPPKSQEELDQIYQDGKKRYENRFPPGYEDRSKSKGSDNLNSIYMHNGLIYRNEYGDVVLWKQVINQAKDQKWKKVILITDDEKEDWWWTIHSKGQKIIGPRPELLEEIKRDAKVSFFYIYNSERFLHYAKTYLEAQVHQESIDQVREISQIQQSKRQWTNWEIEFYFARQTFINWVKENYPASDISTLSGKGEDIFDLLRFDYEKEKVIAYSLFILETDKLSQSRMRRLRKVIEIMRLAKRGKTSSYNEIDEFVLVIITDSDSNIDWIRLFSDEERSELITDGTIKLIAGRITTRNDGTTEFVPDSLSFLTGLHPPSKTFS